MKGAGLATLAAALTLGAPPALAAARAPSPKDARLQGQFRLAGRVTVAKDVKGEHVGQKVVRTWTFNPTCQVGACTIVALVRTRASGSDSLLLHRRAPGYYTGRGSFHAPLRCGRRIYRRGQAVPFKIKLRIIAAAVSGTAVIATRVRASYTNRKRTNLTPCVAALGHDAARYNGRLVLATPPSAGTGH